MAIGGAPEKCVRCTKTVYATEKLSGVDLVFHKGCFKCKDCAVTLNLRNYFKADGDIYCKNHKPSGLRGKITKKDVVKTTHIGPTKPDASSAPAPSTSASGKSLELTQKEKEFIQASGGKCAGCKKDIEGSAVVAAGKIFHGSCFKCRTCGTDIGPGMEFTHKGDGPPACMRCTPKIKCDNCHEFVTDDYVTMGDANMHIKCHTCVVCKKELLTDEFIICGGKSYCGEHEPMGEECSVCNKPVEGDYVAVGARAFHHSCFLCCECGKQCYTSYIEHGGKFYCEQDYRSKHGMKCKKCGNGIPPGAAMLTINDDNFHAECVTCVKCNKVFKDGEQINLTKSGDTICSPCAGV